jgi:hypothetical protein
MFSAIISAAESSKAFLTFETSLVFYSNFVLLIETQKEGRWAKTSAKIV